MRKMTWKLRPMPYYPSEREHCLMRKLMTLFNIFWVIE